MASKHVFIDGFQAMRCCPPSVLLLEKKAREAAIRDEFWRWMREEGVREAKVSFHGWEGSSAEGVMYDGVMKWVFKIHVEVVW